MPHAETGTATARAPSPDVTPPAAGASPASTVSTDVGASPAHTSSSGATAATAGAAGALPPRAALQAACQRWRLLSVAQVASLIVLGTLWEMWLAPLRPSGSLLVFKVLPLVFVLPALVRGWVRAYQLWTMLILLFLCEGIVRGMSDPNPVSAGLAWLEAALSAGSYVTLMLYVRTYRMLVDPEGATRRRRRRGH